MISRIAQGGKRCATPKRGPDERSLGEQTAGDYFLMALRCGWLGATRNCISTSLSSSSNKYDNASSKWSSQVVELVCCVMLPPIPRLLSGSVKATMEA